MIHGRAVVSFSLIISKFYSDEAVLLLLERERTKIKKKQQNSFLFIHIKAFYHHSSRIFLPPFLYLAQINSTTQISGLYFEYSFLTLTIRTHSKTPKILAYLLRPAAAITNTTTTVTSYTLLFFHSVLKYENILLVA